MKPSDSLSQVLQRWRLNPPTDPAFRSSVWQRIEASRHPTGWLAFARTHAAALSLALIVTAGISGWTGHALAQNKAKIDRDVVSTLYLASLDASIQVNTRN